MKSLWPFPLTDRMGNAASRQDCPGGALGRGLDGTRRRIPKNHSGGNGQFQETEFPRCLLLVGTGIAKANLPITQDSRQIPLKQQRPPATITPSFQSECANAPIPEMAGGVLFDEVPPLPTPPPLLECVQSVQPMFLPGRVVEPSQK